MYVACYMYQEMRSSCWVLVEKPGGKNSLEDVGVN